MQGPLGQTGCFLFLSGMAKALNPCRSNGCQFREVTGSGRLGGGPMASQESSGCLAALRYSCKNPSLQSETVHYKRGVSQQFSLPSFKIDFSEWKDDEVILGNSHGAQTYMQVKHPCT